MTRPYDLIIVGAGLYGAVIAQQAVGCGLRVLVIEKRDHVAGYCYSFPDAQTGLIVHRHGAHIFHTKQKYIWDYVNRFAQFVPYVHRVRARIGGITYPLPINLSTLRDFFGVSLEANEVDHFLSLQRGTFREPQNFEEKAVNLVGWKLYEGFVRNYSAKQWGVAPKDLPSTMKLQIDVRPSTDDRYFGDRYQGVPVDGYTPMIQRMLTGADLDLGVDFCQEPHRWQKLTKGLVYTGPLDRYFNFRHGPLKWREITHELKVCSPASKLESPVVNINDDSSDCTRIADYSQLSASSHTGGPIVLGWERLTSVNDNERAYVENRVLKPVRFDEEEERLVKYQRDASREHHVYFGGRMADYRLYDMEHVVALAMKAARSIVSQTSSGTLNHRV